MAGEGLSAMKPADASTALRSLPRRFRDAARAAVLELDAEPDPARVDAVASRLGPSGTSALDHLASAIAILEVARKAVRAALVSDDAHVEIGLLRLPPGASRAAEGSTLDGEVAELAGVAEAFASLVDGADAGRWLSRAHDETGDETNALEVLEAAVRGALAELRDLERVLRAARGRG